LRVAFIQPAADDDRAIRIGCLGDVVALDSTIGQRRFDWGVCGHFDTGMGVAAGAVLDHAREQLFQRQVDDGQESGVDPVCPELLAVAVAELVDATGKEDQGVAVGIEFKQTTGRSAESGMPPAGSWRDCGAHRRRRLPDSAGSVPDHRRTLPHGPIGRRAWRRPGPIEPDFLWENDDKWLLSG